jgi:hypothetical protein
MEHVKIENTTITNNDDAEIVTEVQNLIVKINNLLWRHCEPEYLVDLMSDELIARYGRERLEEVAGEMMKNPIEAPELSRKFTELWRPLLDRFWNGYPPFGYKVEVRYEIDRPDFGQRFDNKAILAVPASGEPIIVDRMLDKMSSLREGIRSANAWIDDANDRFCAGEPQLEPGMRRLSAEEYIAKASREPITPQQWRAQQLQLAQAAQVGGAELN